MHNLKLKYLFSQLGACLIIRFFFPEVYPGPLEEVEADISRAILLSFLFLRNTLNKPLDLQAMQHNTQSSNLWPFKCIIVKKQAN